MLLFDTLKKPLLEWYSILETLGFKVGEDYYWTHDHETHMWGARFNYPKQETITLLKANGFTFKEVTMSDKKKWVLEVQEDPETGDCILPFPPDLLEEAGWVEGDTIKWTDLGDGAWSMHKQEHTYQPFRVTLTTTQVDSIVDTIKTHNCDSITLIVNNSNGIGPAITLEYDGKIDITDVRNW